MGGQEPDGPFDAAAYWRTRMTASPDLTGTGSRGLPLAWQHTLYRAKRRAVEAALADHGVDVAGLAVLDLGCGTGWFEDLWEAHGASRVAGIDLVPELVADLQARHPHREYEVADLTAPRGSTSLAGFDLTTAIDVLYHVVDDAGLDRLLGRLLAPAITRRWFLLTDDLRGGAPWRHVRFRSREDWEARLAAHGFAVVAARPMYVVHDRQGWWDARLPEAAGRARLWADRALVRLAPSWATMHAVLAERAPGPA